jgi:hypothetical protein
MKIVSNAVADMVFMSLIKHLFQHAFSIIHCVCYAAYIDNTVESAYNDIGLYETSPIQPDILWHQLIPSLLTITL